MDTRAKLVSPPEKKNIHTSSFNEILSKPNTKEYNLFAHSCIVHFTAITAITSAALSS